MSVRLAFGRFLIRLGRLVELMAVSFMRPGDLIEFNRRKDLSSETLSRFSNPEWIHSGLREEEELLLQQIPSKGGNLLLFGPQGGRMSLALHKRDYRVTGTDPVAEKADLTLKNMVEAEAPLQVLDYDSQFHEAYSDQFDLAWMSEIYYSSIPTRKKRIQLLKKISLLLKPGGILLGHFMFDADHRSPGRILWIRKVFALITLGNFRMEPGDMIQEGQRFVHVYRHMNEISREFESGGFEIYYFQTPPDTVWGGLCAKINNK
jgi:SAM-dependent methyltransferase